jgi:hypothetical protein
MTRKTLALVLLLVTAASSASGQVLVRGVVLNTDSIPLPGTSIEISDTARANVLRAIADSLGGFIIRIPAPLPRGGLLVRAEQIGYRTMTGRLAAEDRQQLDILLTMDVAAIPLAPLRVTARDRYQGGRLDEFYDRAVLVGRMGGGTIITYEQLQRRAGANVAMIVAENMPGARNCPPAYFLDGIRVTLQDLSFTSALDVEGIEIYRTLAMVPVQYQDRAGCGAVLVWTRADDRGGGTPLTWRRVFIALGVIATLFLLMR